MVDVMGSQSTALVGTVKASNTHGVKIAEQSEWLNYSKYAKPEDLNCPPIGQRASIVLDKAGYIRVIQAADVQPNGHKPAAPASMPTNAHASQVEGIAPDRERIISRQAVLNSAIAFTQSTGKPASLDEVLAVAAKLEQWVWRCE